MFKRIIFFLLFFSCSIFSMKKSVIYFAHGLPANESHGKKYEEQGFFPGCDVKTFNFPDAMKKRGKANFKKTSVGQENEIEAFVGRIKEDEKELDNTQFFFVGGSRGAMCITNVFDEVMYKKYFKDGVLLKNLGGIVLESPARHVKDIVHSVLKLKGLGGIPKLDSVIDRFFLQYYLGKYNHKGPHPIDSVVHIPKHVPVLITCAKKDPVTSAISSLALAEALIKAGHNDVYVWCAEHGSHGKILGSRDTKIYKTIVASFLKRCGVDHNEVCDQKFLDELRCEGKNSFKRIQLLKQRALAYSARRDARRKGCMKKLLPVLCFGMFICFCYWLFLKFR